MNPYHPPTNQDPVEIGTQVCPDCGSLMAPGAATGSLYWTNEGTSAFRRFLTRGKVLMGGSFRITLRAPRLAGFHCWQCGLTQLRENR